MLLRSPLLKSSLVTLFIFSACGCGGFDDAKVQKEILAIYWDVSTNWEPPYANAPQGLNKLSRSVWMFEVSNDEMLKRYAQLHQSPETSPGMKAKIEELTGLIKKQKEEAQRWRSRADEKDPPGKSEYFQLETQLRDLVDPDRERFRR